jgi:hypothetical protein
MNEQKFMTIIKELMSKHNINHIDAILLFCEENEIEVEDVKPFIGKSLKSAVKNDAEETGLMISRTAKLPL